MWNKMDFHLDDVQRAICQICSIYSTDNHQVMSHLKKHLKHTMKELIEESERWDLEAKSSL